MHWQAPQYAARSTVQGTTRLTMGLPQIIRVIKVGYPDTRLKLNKQELSTCNHKQVTHRIYPQEA